MQLEHFFDVSQAQDLKTFERQLLGMANEIGFGLVTCALVIDNQRINGKVEYFAVSNTPQAFAESSKDSDAVARDPVVKRMKETSIPFLYNQDLYVAESAADLWEEQAAYGYKTGIAVALHLPENRHFLLGVDREQALPTAGRELSRMMADLQLLAVHAQSAASRLMAPASAEKRIKFTQRELEVLKWTRAGKSAWEAGQILGLSEQGVNYHMRSIFLKLDVSSKHLAVLKAIDLGIIS